MKNRLSLLGLTIILIFVMTTDVYAATTLEFTNRNKLEYTGNISDMGSAFSGIAPGEKKSQTITILNSNSNEANFYMETETLKSLEETVEASGGLYSVELTVTGPSGAVTLLDNNLGGSSGDTITGYTEDRNGLAAINSSALSKSTFLTTLKKGQTATVKLTIGMDGESIRNEYAAAFGEIDFGFEVMYDTPTGQVIVNKVVKTGSGAKNEIVETFKNVYIAVKTGDTTTMGLFIIILIIGISTLIITNKKNNNTEEM